MRWTCPKCGKKLEISNEQLIANDGVIVCPQCLLQAHQPIPKARVTAREEKPAKPVKREQTNIDFESTTPPEYRPTSPPPHKTRMKQAKTSYRYTGLSGSDGNNARPSTKKKTFKLTTTYTIPPRDVPTVLTVTSKSDLTDLAAYLEKMGFRKIKS